MNAVTREAIFAERTSMAEWYAESRHHHFMESRAIGGIGMFEFFQPPGSFDKPGMDIFLLQVALRCEGHVTLDMGGDRAFSARPLPGSFVLSVPGARTTYDLPVETHGIALELNTSRVRLLAAELDPRFDGHFAPLYTRMWRDHRLRDDVLRLWRAAKGDAFAPMVDPDAALMTLTRRLLGTCDPRRPTDDTARRLAPHALRRVLDYVEAHLDGDCNLFRLAAEAELSPYHFARAFRGDMGDPPHRYVIARRLLRATELIRSSNMELSEIALACGFSSQARMTEIFTRHLGTTPGRMRRAATEGRPALYIFAPPPPARKAQEFARRAPA
jgi:AraC family transcriptional regulator